ncbi:MAG: N-acetyltransferase [Terricaulis sp.]|nr:N-acetyltransferase [Terricaulis sp.]
MRSRLTLGADVSYALVAELPEHAAPIERVLARAFGPGRFAKTSERVREQGAVFEPALSRVAINDAGAVMGVCRIWRVRAGVELYFLGPLAVDPDEQMAGLGAALTRAAVDACRANGGNGVVLVGAARFFQPLGFSLVPLGAIALPGPVDWGRFLWCELRPGGLSAARGPLSAPR